MKKTIWISLCLTLGLFADLKIGQHFPKQTFTDQFDNTMQVGKQDRWVCVTFEKNVAVALTKEVKKVPKGYLEKHRVRFISDISAMPSFITAMFALPMMKKYPFSVWLIRDESGKVYDRKPGMVTLYRLKRGKVASKRFIEPQALLHIVDK